MPLVFVAFLLLVQSFAAQSTPLIASLPAGPETRQKTQQPEAKEMKRVRGCIQVGKLKRYYVVCSAPPDQTRKPPVVIVLHGALGNAWTAEFDSAMTAQAGKLGFVVVYPYGTGLGSKQVLFWNAGACCALASKNRIDDVAFIDKLIEKIKADYSADPKRIYVAGASNGGMMAYRLANELSGQLAAMGSVEGCMFPASAQPQSPVSIIEFHGTADSVIPYLGGTGKKLGYRVKNVPSTLETTAFWVKHNNCLKEPMIETFAGGKRETYAGGDGGSAVRLVTITDGQHLWPGGRCATIFGDAPARSLNATAEMLDFFIKHPKP